MFCNNCGKEISEHADVCTNCGKFIEHNQAQSKDFSRPKTGMGVLFALILGIVGLIIGICIYPEGTIARKTFIKSWSITFGISFGVSIVIGIIVYAVTLSAFIPY